MRQIALAVTLMIAVAAPSQAARRRPAERAPVTVVVQTPGHKFVPGNIRIPANVPVRLVLRNPSGSDHEFRADEFFQVARINDADVGRVDVNRIRLPKYGSASVRLIVPPGRYPVKSTTPLDAVAGMDGEIVAY